jgi:hypothetical protein
VPRTAFFAVPVATEALTANVTLSLGFAAVDPVASATAPGEAANFLRFRSFV